MRGFVIPTLRASARMPQPISCVMEINPLLHSLKDISERTQALRRYL
jgi:hypothetical protein